MPNMMQQKLQADALRNPGSGLNLGAPYLGPPQAWPQQQVNPGGQVMPQQAKPQGQPFQANTVPQSGISMPQPIAQEMPGPLPPQPLPTRPLPPQTMPPQQQVGPPQLGQPPQITPLPYETPGKNRQIQPTGKY
jgi:hypothetical protein